MDSWNETPIPDRLLTGSSGEHPFASLVATGVDVERGNDRLRAVTGDEARPVVETPSTSPAVAG